MPVIDRTLLRMATYELIERPDVPTGAVISEAVDLAKEYSTEESGRFVNGVLASVAAEVRPAPGAQGDEAGPLAQGDKAGHAPAGEDAGPAPAGDDG
jgi:hypothetical protein